MQNFCKFSFPSENHQKTYIISLRRVNVRAKKSVQHFCWCTVTYTVRQCRFKESRALNWPDWCNIELGRGVFRYAWLHLLSWLLRDDIFCLQNWQSLNCFFFFLSQSQVMNFTSGSQKVAIASNIKRVYLVGLWQWWLARVVSDCRLWC